MFYYLLSNGSDFAFLLSLPPLVVISYCTSALVSNSLPINSPSYVFGVKFGYDSVTA